MTHCPGSPRTAGLPGRGDFQSWKAGTRWQPYPDGSLSKGTHGKTTRQRLGTKLTPARPLGIYQSGLASPGVNRSICHRAPPQWRGPACSRAFPLEVRDLESWLGQGQKNGASEPLGLAAATRGGRAVTAPRGGSEDRGWDRMRSRFWHPLGLQGPPCLPQPWAVKDLAQLLNNNKKNYASL